jgi:hypothetical protein
MTRTRLGVAAVAWLLLFGTACSDDSKSDLALPGAASYPDDDADTTTAETSDPLLGEVFHVAQALDEQLVVRAAAQESADEVVTLDAADQVSGKVVCLVVQQVGEWVEVRLPSGPDESGWVARDDVALSRHRFRIEISLADHLLTLYTGEIVTLEAPVALGPDAPAAGERLFVTALVQPPAGARPYAAYAYGLSGADNDLDAFRAGEGVVAVHGIADDDTLGGDMPSGAIGIADDVVTRLADAIGLPLGTPVDIVE